MSKTQGKRHSQKWATPVDMGGSPADHWYFKQCRLGPDEGRSLLVLVGEKEAMRCYETAEHTPSRSVRKCSSGCFQMLMSTFHRDSEDATYRSWQVIGHPTFSNAVPLYKTERDPAEVNPVGGTSSSDMPAGASGAGTASAGAASG